MSTITLTAQDKTTIRVAAHGSIALLSFAGVATSPHKISTAGTLSLASATGLTGHALAEKPKGEKLDYANGAVLADQVLPALTASAALLKNDPAEAANFRATILTAVTAAAEAPKGGATPPVTEMIRKITAALDAA